MKRSLRSLVLLSSVLLFSACRAGGKMVGGPSGTELDGGLSGQSIESGVATLGGGLSGQSIESGAATVANNPIAAANGLEDVMGKLDYQPYQPETYQPIVTTPSETPPEEKLAEKTPEPVSDGGGENKIASSSAGIVTTKPETTEKPVSHSCLDYLPADADAVGTFNLTDIELSYFWTSLNDSFPDISKLREGVKELCFAIKYPKTPETTVSSNSIQSLSNANQTPPQTFSLLDGNSISGGEPVNSFSSLSTNSNTSALSASQSLLQAAPEPTAREQILEMAGDFVLVAHCDDSSCTARLLDACREKLKTDTAAGKPAFACKADKNIFVSGSETWSNAMFTDGVIVATDGNRFDPVLSTTRAATLKIAGIFTQEFQDMLQNNFTAMSFTTLEKTVPVFALALTANATKIFMHFVGFDRFITLEDLKNLVEPSVEGLVGFTPSANFTFNSLLEQETAVAPAPQ